MRAAKRKAPDRVQQIKLRLCDLPDEASALFRSYTSAAEPTAVPGYELVLAYVAGWAMFVEEGVRAVIFLQNAGFSAQAAPIRRSLLEHGVTCHAVATNPEVFGGILRKHQHSAKKFLAAGKDAGLSVDESQLIEVLNWEINESTKPWDYLTHAEAKFRNLVDGGQALYTQWLGETALSHANLVTAGLYLRPTPDDEYPTLVNRPVDEPEDWFVAATCTDALLLALQSLSSVTLGDPLASEISMLNRERNDLMDELGYLIGGA